MPEPISTSRGPSPRFRSEEPRALQRPLQLFEREPEAARVGVPPGSGCGYGPSPERRSAASGRGAEGTRGAPATATAAVSGGGAARRAIRKGPPRGYAGNPGIVADPGVLGVAGGSPPPLRGPRPSAATRRAARGGRPRRGTPTPGCRTPPAPSPPRGLRAGPPPDARAAPESATAPARRRRRPARARRTARGGGRRRAQVP